MSTPKLFAQMSLRCCGASLPVGAVGPCWQLYLVVMGSSHWPAHTWPKSAQIPTLARRDAALADLGYTRVDGAEWEWIEHGEDECRVHLPKVRLLGAVEVRPLSCVPLAAGGGRPGKGARL